MNNPARTAEAFIPSPFSQNGDTRLYKTGDLARYLPTGEIEFLGRIDHQVKLRGFRIEPGEIETTLALHPAVQSAVVLVREETPGDQRLVAYLLRATKLAEQEEPAARKLRDHLGKTLPDYMVPSAFIWLEQWPLMPNGKVDRRALPALLDVKEPEAGGRMVGPRTPTEEVLAGIWEQVLDRPQVSVQAHFFELGGNSLLATQIIARIREYFHQDLSLRSLFEAPTIADLAQIIEQTRVRVQKSLPDKQIKAIAKVNRSSAKQLLAKLDQLSINEINMLLGNLMDEKEK